MEEQTPFSPFSRFTPHCLGHKRQTAVDRVEFLRAPRQLPGPLQAQVGGLEILAPQRAVETSARLQEAQRTAWDSSIYFYIYIPPLTFTTWPVM